MTTQTNPLLAELEDILLPPPVTELPIAPGYWLLTAVIVFFIGITVRALYLRRRYHAPRKAALSLLMAYDLNRDEFAAEVNTLLKRTALSYLPRRQLAGLNGPEWFNWLDTRLPIKHRQKIGPILVKRHQAQGLTAEDKQTLFNLAKVWLSNTDAFTQTHLAPVQQEQLPC